MNDEGLKRYAVLAISEPHVWRTDKALRIIFIYHKNWTKVILIVHSEDRWAIRSIF